MKNEPAFPIQDAYSRSTEQGMTLRDYFAAKAMQGFASTLTGTAPVLFDVLSRDAYLMADAMLKARES